MKIVAIVPMKLNNRRIPQKNTKSFTNGMPLCHYILSTLLTVDEIDEVYVYCSNPDIYGINAMIYVLSEVYMKEVA